MPLCISQFNLTQKQDSRWISDKYFLIVTMDSQRWIGVLVQGQWSRGLMSIEWGRMRKETGWIPVTWCLVVFTFWCLICEDNNYIWLTETCFTFQERQNAKFHLQIVQCSIACIRAGFSVYFNVQPIEIEWYNTATVRLRKTATMSSMWCCDIFSPFFPQNGQTAQAVAEGASHRDIVDLLINHAETRAIEPSSTTDLLWAMSTQFTSSAPALNPSVCETRCPPTTREQI